MRFWIILCFLSSILLAVSFRTTETRAVEKAAAYDSLERALRQVLTAISCRELTATELEHLFREYASLGNISSCIEEILKSLEIPNREDCKGTQLLHFLDFRHNGSNQRCMLQALPRLRLISNSSEMAVFPAYYMDWECSSDCDEQIWTPRNYELMQRTNTCSENTADWRVIEAAETHSLNVTSHCI